MSDFIQMIAKEEISQWKRLPLGDTAGRNEAWLRDTLQAHPELLPIADIDPSFGPLLPVCTELITDAGPIDNVFINHQGKLTLVECKLWRNPEARRKVVAQLLDYARVLAGWSYADLQRQVSSRKRQSGNVLFQIAQSHLAGIEEHQFVDLTARALRQGRFLLLIAGDGIREDVQAIGELINRNAALGFAFGMIEFALYSDSSNGLLIQPRVVAKTQLIERTIISLPEGVSIETPEPDEQLAVRVASDRAPIDTASMEAWWSEIVGMHFDDPDQPEARYFYPNHVRAPLPWPGTWITGYRVSNSRPRVGVFVSGQRSPLAELLNTLRSYKSMLEQSLPKGTDLTFEYGPYRNHLLSDFASEAEQKVWLKKTMNQFVNALRPVIRQAMQLH